MKTRQNLADPDWQTDPVALEQMGLLDEAEQLMTEEAQRESDLRKIRLERYETWLKKIKRKAQKHNT